MLSVVLPYFEAYLPFKPLMNLLTRIKTVLSGKEKIMHILFMLLTSWSLQKFKKKNYLTILPRYLNLMLEYYFFD